VAQLYEGGCEQGLGVLIDMFCLVTSQPCCYIWVPKNEREAELALLAGLKFSAPSNPQVAEPVFNDANWRFHASLGQSSGADKWLDHLPTRIR
jgi:hypothetical protein